MANVIGSLVSDGCLIEGRLEHLILSPGIKVGRNCVIGCGVGEDDFPGPEIQGGETIELKRRPAW